MKDCIFCKIGRGESGELIYENKDVAAFNDINPKAPVHILIIPKKHITSLAELPENDGRICMELVMAAKKLAEEKGIAQSGYRLQINVGREGGQVVPHLHLHLIGGKHLGE
jgi:histidine triad (HIT) family protein